MVVFCLSLFDIKATSALCLFDPKKKATKEVAKKKKKKAPNGRLPGEKMNTSGSGRLLRG